MVKVCIVKSCPSGRSKKATKSVSFFQPSTKVKLQRWAQSLKMNLKPSDYVCQHHFKEEHMKLYDEIKIGNTVHLHYSIRRTLKEEALPTVEYQSQYYVDPKKLKKQLLQDQKLSHRAHQLHLNQKPQLDQQEHENKEQEIENSSSEEEMQLTYCLQSLENIKKNIEKFSMLPAYWFYADNPDGVEFMRIDPSNKQIIKHIVLNEDLSITVVCSNNERVTLNDKIMSFKDIKNYLKSAERWRLCVGTQIERRKFSKKCKGLIIGDEAYKRFQMNPRCKSCRVLRNQLLKRRNVTKVCEHPEQMDSLQVFENNTIFENRENSLSSSLEDLINDEDKNIAIIVQEDSETEEINTLLPDNLLVVKEEETIQTVKTELKTRRKVYKCGLCMKRFYSIQHYKAHNLTHQTKIVYLNKCGTCNKSFMTRIGFRQHLQKCQKNVGLNHIKYKSLPISNMRESLRQHMKQQFICHVCGEGCISRRSLKDHLESHKEQKKRNQYICEQCGKIFCTNKKLRSHQRVHYDRNFICEICQCTFKAKYNLEQHLLIHQKSYKCEDCQKTFATRIKCIEHSRMHSGERPFECSYCSKCFTSKRMLSVHILIHTGEKRHKCHICDQRFIQRGSLNRHMKIHAKALNQPMDKITDDTTNE